MNKLQGDRRVLGEEAVCGNATPDIGYEICERPMS